MPNRCEKTHYSVLIFIFWVTFFFLLLVTMSCQFRCNSWCMILINSAKTSFVLGNALTTTEPSNCLLFKIRGCILLLVSIMAHCFKPIPWLMPQSKAKSEYNKCTIYKKYMWATLVKELRNYSNKYLVDTKRDLCLNFVSAS